MRRRKLPNFQANAEKHHQRTDTFVEALTSDLRERSVASTLQLLGLVHYDGSEELSLADYPHIKQALQKVRQTYAQRLRLGVASAVAREWGLAESQQNEFARQALSLFSLERGGRYEGYFPKNEGALQAFLKRREEGLKLSDKIWDLSGEHMQSLERAISTAVHDGWSAATLSKRVSQYLKDYPKLKQDYGLRYGKAIDVQDCEYKSARLARTEINMAYREAELTRWAQLDFVVGYEIKRSEREYACPVCSALAGKYPKDFRWAGWHPNCRCYSIPILSTDDEFWASSAEHPLSSSVNEVKDTPENFKVWLSENAQRNEQAKARGTQPYFLRDNPKYTETHPNKPQQASPALSPLERAKARQAQRTPEQIEFIKLKAWDRQLQREYPNIGEAERQALVKSWLQIEKELGIKKGAMMSIEQADKQSANPHYQPKYINGRRNPKYIEGYATNCQTCSPAYMLRLQGFDVTAKMKTKGSLLEYLSRQRSFEAWSNYDGTPVAPVLQRDWLIAKGYKQMTSERWREYFLDTCREEGVYLLTIGWKGRGGHATILQRTKDGLFYVEPQVYNEKQGALRSISELCLRGGSNPISTRGILRIDNKLFNPKFLSIFEK